MAENKRKPERHGMSYRPEYISWGSMVQRCTNKKSQSYRYYGARGIKIQKSWLRFSQFYKDMGPRPSLKHSLERIDNNSNYCKQNCCWLLQSEQAKNTRRTKTFLVNGKKIFGRKALAMLTGLTVKAVERRINSGRSVEDMMTVPFGWRKDTIVVFRGIKYRSYKHLCDSFGVHYGTFGSRFHNRRWTLEQALFTDNSNNGGMGKKKHEGTR